ncbi:hypothetical protein MPH_10189 [Macrophomina phaseolina MS6]|uniref:Uncharacterized protein n=1 Tax=Macrophomina phaseolina (strain MS6) TaxID=1126212 RepID=K2S744_MACPH|nr:hypothetical protein MPH_10189 [Macrophomina phaseolina MS6]
MQLANEDHIRGRLDDLIFEFLHNRPGAYVNWHRLYRPDQPARNHHDWTFHVQEGAKRDKDWLIRRHRIRRPLFNAARWNLWRVVEKLIRAGEDVNAWNSGNWSAMHIAAQEASLESVELLVRLGNVNIDQADWAGFRPLHSAAVWKKNPHIFEWLLQNSADAQASSHIGGLPLQGAAFDSAPEVVATMLRNGVNPRTFCEHYHNETVFLAAPLQHAAYSGSIRCIELLLENGAGQYGTVLAAAVYGGNRDMVGALLDAGVPYEEFALEEAAAWKDLTTVERHSFIDETVTRAGEQLCSSILEAAKMGSGRDGSPLHRGRCAY